MSKRDKWVRRFSVDEIAKHKNGFTIYKITSVLFPIESPEALSAVSVWKRYSDVQRLHSGMRVLHSGLHLTGTFPQLPTHSFFKRFQQEVIAERAKSIQDLMEFIAEHRLLFSSTEFVNFLQTGYPEPEARSGADSSAGGVIAAIRSSLQLPVEEAPPLEHPSEDEAEAELPAPPAPAAPGGPAGRTLSPNCNTDPMGDIGSIAKIPIYEAADVDYRESPTPKRRLSPADSFESIDSLGSIDSDLYEEVNKVTIDKPKPSVKSRAALPDLITFDGPAASRFEDYHTMSETNGVDANCAVCDVAVCASGTAQPDREREDTVSVNSSAGDVSVSASEMAIPNKKREDTVSVSSVICDVSVSASETAIPNKKREDTLSVNSSAGDVSVSASETAIPNKDREDAVSVNSSACDVSVSASEMGIPNKDREDAVSVSSVVCAVSCASGTAARGSAAWEERGASTADGYVFEAGYALGAAGRWERAGEFRRAFRCYKAAIETLLLGVRADTDPQRRALIKDKIHKYLSHAETIYKEHLCDDAGAPMESERDGRGGVCAGALPAAMLRRRYEELAQYRVLRVLDRAHMLVAHTAERRYYAMKVIQKVPNNLTEFDEYFLQRTNETRTPILPTDVPYMVPLHAYIETSNLIFLILAYAPGKKLFDFIRDHRKSAPDAPARGVNLENVFPRLVQDEDNKHKNEDFNKTMEQENNNSPAAGETDIDNSDVSVKELVVNSQRLLRDVDIALREPGVAGSERDGNTRVSAPDRDGDSDGGAKGTSSVKRVAGGGCGGAALPAGALRRWGAELLLAIHGLHNCGVICRDLHPDNILLGDNGHVILTYTYGYPGLEMAVARSRSRGRSRGRGRTGAPDLYAAPELRLRTCLEPGRDEAADRLCDYWSYGALMYEMICGVPLRQHHRGPFTSHSLLHVPAGVALEARELLTQLLTYDPSERLGAGRDGVEEIKRHPYFKSIDWQHVYDSWTSPG